MRSAAGRFRYRCSMGGSTSRSPRWRMPDQTPDKDAADDLASSTLTARMSWSSAEIAALRNLLADEERRRVHLCEVMDAENTRIINEKIAVESEIAALRSQIDALRAQAG